MIALLSVHTSPLASLGGRKTGGMNVYVRELARELGRRGIPVDVFTRRYHPDLPVIDTSLGENVRVVHINAGPPQVLDPDDVYPHLSSFTSGVIAFGMKHDTSYDMIYAHYWLSGLVAHQLQSMWHVPFVQMFHTLGHMKHRISEGNAPLLRIASERQIVSWADRIIAATPAEQMQLRWLYRADRRKIDIVPPGVDISRFHPVAQAEARRRLGLREDKCYFLFVGRIEPLKSIGTILRAADELPDERLRVLVVGGDPDDPSDPEMVRLQQMHIDSGLGKRVQFLGAKGQDVLPLYYSAATAVIMPSEYESFGMVALEAMASGTPVIATETGGLAYLVRDDETGYLIPVHDAEALAHRMRCLMDDPEKQRLLGRNAYAEAQQYAWFNITDRVLSVLSPRMR